MSKKFVIKWMWFKENKQIFIGAGIVVGAHFFGWCISNLFIGFEKIK